MAKKSNSPQDSNANAKALHSFLLSNKVTGIPKDPNQFISQIDEGDNVRNIHNTLKQLGVRNVPEMYDDFRKKLSLPSESLEEPKMIQPKKVDEDFEITRQSKNKLRKKLQRKNLMPKKILICIVNL